MKYFIDTEFLEGTQKEKFPISLFKKETCNTIDLISIGIISEDNREYYAISKDFNLKEAWNRFQINDVWVNNIGTQKKVYWIRENVLKPIFFELKEKEVYENNDSENTVYFDNSLIKEMINKIWELNESSINYKELRRLINKYGKTNKEISEEIKDFISQKNLLKTPADNFASNELKSTFEGRMKVVNHCFGKPEFYGYYADYDWVVFCWLFGKMMDLPIGFPMYCIDLKQELDKKVESLNWLYGRDIWNNQNRSVFTIGKRESQETDRVATFDEKLKVLKELQEYPKQTNEHNALADAKWNKQLYKFLNIL